MEDVNQTERYESVYNTLVYLRDDIFPIIRENIPLDHHTEANSFDVSYEYVVRAISYLTAAMDNHSEDYKRKVNKALYLLEQGYILSSESIELLKSAVNTSR